MYKIEYNLAYASLYADNIVKRLDKKIARVLSSSFQHTFGKGAATKTVTIQVSPNGFTKQFLEDYREHTNLKLLLKEGVSYLRDVITRVRSDSPEHFVKLDNAKYTRCYAGQHTVDDFHTVMTHLFVDLGYNSSLLDKEEIVDSLNLKICPYCGHNYIGSIKYRRQDGKLNVAKAQIDHFFSKGQYPFLAMSYANFVPSCPACNEAHKYTQDVMDANGRMRLMSPYEFDYNKFQFYFGLKKMGLMDDDNIEVKTRFDVFTADDLALKDGYEQILGIDKLYEYHNDVVMDILIKKMIELTAQRYYYEKGIKIDGRYLNRYITAYYGYEPSPQDDRKRIMSKFIRDIVRQVEDMTEKSKLLCDQKEIDESGERIPLALD